MGIVNLSDDSFSGDGLHGNIEAAIAQGRRMLELNPRVDMLPRPDPAHPEAYAPSLVRPRVMPH